MSSGSLSRFVRLTLCSTLIGVTLMGCSDERPEGSSDTPSNADPAHLEPFDPDVAPVEAPDLPARLGVPGQFDAVIAVQMMDAAQEAAESRDVEYASADANGDLAEFRSQAETMLSRGLGAWWRYSVYTADDLAQQALDRGIFSMSEGSGAVHTQIATNQGALGAAQANAAAKWAEENLAGNAKVVLLHDGEEAPAARLWYQAVNKVLEDSPGMEVVFDQQIKEYSAEEGANVMASVLQAHPDVNIVIGHAGVMAGVLATFEAEGRGNDPDVYLSANNVGDDLLAKIEEGDTVLRSGWAAPWPLLGYALGILSSDWLEGRSVPKMLAVEDYTDINTPEAARTWREDMLNPQVTWETKREEYVTLWGNIDYSTRDEYWRGPILDPKQLIDSDG